MRSHGTYNYRKLVRPQYAVSQCERALDVLSLCCIVRPHHINTLKTMNVKDNIWPVIAINTRNSSGDEIANVNLLYDDIVHVLQNTIDSCINSATDRRGYVLERMFTKFS